jgi:hypothetical protein
MVPEKWTSKVKEIAKDRATQNFTLFYENKALQKHPNFSWNWCRSYAAGQSRLLVALELKANKVPILRRGNLKDYSFQFAHQYFTKLAREKGIRFNRESSQGEIISKSEIPAAEQDWEETAEGYPEPIFK